MSSDKERPDVAVVILNWNGRRLLDEFLPSVVKHTDTSVGKVIVADNGSTDDSVEFLKERFVGVEIFSLDKNYGFAGGYNLVVEHYSKFYRYVVLLNSDVAVDDNWLLPMYEFMEANPGVGACQPKILSYRSPEEFEYAGASGGFIDRYGYPYCRGRVFGTVETDHGQYDDPIPVFWATGAALMVRSEIYLKAGGLDTAFFAHMEEIDLCWRIHLMGFGIYVVPRSHVFHLGGGSLDASNPKKTYLNFRNNLLMLYKNLPRKVSRRTLFVRRLLDTVAWLKFIAVFDRANAAAIMHAHCDFRKMKKQYTTFPDVDLLHTDPPRPNILVDYYLRGRRFWRR